jgi:hypothetical protein
MLWEVDQERAAVLHAGSKEENGLVLSLCNILSVLYQHQKQRLHVLEPYSPEKMRLYRSMEELEMSILATEGRSKHRDPLGWMGGV